MISECSISQPVLHVYLLYCPQITAIQELLFYDSLIMNLFLIPLLSNY